MCWFLPCPALRYLPPPFVDLGQSLPPSLPFAVARPCYITVRIQLEHSAYVPLYPDTSGPADGGHILLQA